MTDLAALAARLDEAARTATPVAQLTASGSLDVPAAYQIQRQLVQLRSHRGQQLTGLKMGLTSRAKMQQVGVDQPIWGRLTDHMQVPDGGQVRPQQFIHPRAEPEVAFLLTGVPGPFHAAVAAVAPAVEIIDSRYTAFQFTLPDVIADNASAAGYVLGPWQPVPPGLDNLGVLLEVNGEVVQSGSTAAILGDPRRALTQAVELASGAGLAPAAGWVLLAGAATAAVPLAPGTQVRAVVESLGTASLHMTASASG